MDRPGVSPLGAFLIRAAADDLERGGIVAELFVGVDTPAGSVPSLRLLASLHELVLDGRAATRAEFFPSVGGDRPAPAAWTAAEAVLREHADDVRRALRRTVQTNEVGRSAILYAALLWLTATDRRPIRLLEIGASGGLNLVCDRYAYVVGGVAFGGGESAVVFDEPWHPGPPVDLSAAAGSLAIDSRRGCDPSPIDIADGIAQRRLEAYVWPDQPDRLARLRAAVEIARTDPPLVDAASAAVWLPERLAEGSRAVLTVVWQSVVRQYVPDHEWAHVERAYEAALTDGVDAVWLQMEPASAPDGGFGLAYRRGEKQHLLAITGHHGPPLQWLV